MDQTSLFDPIPCRICLESVTPHWLANYRPPLWVAAHGPRCGNPVYAPSREAVVIDWNAVQSLSPQETTP